MRKIQKRRACLSVRGAMFALSILFSGVLHAQQVDSMEIMDYSNPKEYEIGGVRVVGNLYSDANAVSSISGLKVGSTIQIPGP